MIEPITTPKRGLVHLEPELLPGEVAVLFSISTWENPENTAVAVRSLKTGEERILITGGSTAKYSPTGHLIYARDQSLYAVPFDIDRLDIRGPATKVVENVAVTPLLGTAQYAFSRNGTLAFLPAPATGGEGIFWVSRSGDATPVLELAGRPATQPSVSPDGQQIAIKSGTDVWVLDRRTAALRRLTFDGFNYLPIWTPDGQRIVFSSNSTQQFALNWVVADGTAVAEALTKSPNIQVATSASTDGQDLIFMEMNPDWTIDVWTLPLQGEKGQQPLLSGSFSESWPTISPDGRWLAYSSDESGRDEVYVRPYPGPGGKWQVSTSGGHVPKWSRNGREIFYFSSSRLMVAPVTTQPNFQAGPETALFYAGMYDNRYDVTPDGSFLMVKTADPSEYNRIHVVLNWFEELKRLVPN
jgi:serine/threonine-protein kinase